MSDLAEKVSILSEKVSDLNEKSNRVRRKSNRVSSITKPPLVTPIANTVDRKEISNYALRRRSGGLPLFLENLGVFERISGEFLLNLLALTAIVRGRV